MATKTSARVSAAAVSVQPDAERIQPQAHAPIVQLGYEGHQKVCWILALVDAEEAGKQDGSAKIGHPYGHVATLPADCGVTGVRTGR